MRKIYTTNFSLKVFWPHFFDNDDDDDDDDDDDNKLFSVMFDPQKDDG